MIWRTGDQCWLRYLDRTVRAEVSLASGNGRSLMLRFEAVVDGHVGSMPVLMDADGVFRSLVTEEEVTLCPVT